MEPRVFRWAERIAADARGQQDSSAGNADKPSPPSGFLFERLTPDDPNYHLVKHFDLKSWADSFNLVAKGHAGEASLEDFINGCISTVTDGLEVHIAVEDETPISERCRELDRFVEASIGLVGGALLPEVERLGKDGVQAAINEFSSKARELSARAKGRILEAELARSKQPECKWAIPEPIPPGAQAGTPADALPEERARSSEDGCVPEWASHLDTPEGRKAARESWKRHWTTPERDCTIDDLTEIAFNRKDRPFLNQWENGTLRLKDPSRSALVQAIEHVLRTNRPPKWHPAARRPAR